MRNTSLKLRMLGVGSVLLAIYLGFVALFASALPWPAIVGLTLAFVAVQWVLTNKLALRGMDTAELPEAEFGELHRFVEDTAAEMGIDKPKLYVARMGMPNAFALGRRGKSTVVVSEELLATLERREVEAVLAHELAHVRNRDSVVMLLGQSLSTIVSVAVFLVAIASEDLGAIAGWILSSIAGFLINLLVLAISRHREYVADRTARDVLGTGEPLARALETIEARAKDGDARLPADTAALCIVGDGGLLATLLSTHPATEKRVRALRS